MSVFDLNEQQIECLKWQLFYADENELARFNLVTRDKKAIYNAKSVLDIPTKTVQKAFCDIDFVPDDFACEV